MTASAGEDEQQQPVAAAASASASGPGSAQQQQARKALFAAVEGGPAGDTSVLSCRPLVRLFFQDADDNSNSDDEGIDDDSELLLNLLPSDLSARERQLLLLDAVSSHKFQRGHARRLFAALAATLRDVVENEDYVPASAYENDDEDVDEDDDEENEFEDGEDNVDGDANNMEGAEDGEEGDGDGEAASQRGTRRTSFGSSVMSGGAGGIAAEDIEPDAASTEALHFMRACCLLAEAYLRGLVERRPAVGNATNTDREHGIIDEAFQVAELLHDALFSLQSCGPDAVPVQSGISAMCEYWWHSRFEGREQLVTMLVPLLVAKTLDGAASKSDVKRLCAIRPALDLLDFADPSIDHLRGLLLRTASSPLYLRIPEGRKVISHLFRLDADLVPDLHRSIRAQIPDAKKTILEAYGDIYLRSWKDADAAVEEWVAGTDEEESARTLRSAIEDHALQDLVVAALHVADSAVAKSVRVVLAPLHRAKKVPEIDQLLHRLYGPVLWRALSAANSLVRLNAIPVLADTFPLRDPIDEGEDRTAAVVTKTVDVLMALLRDPEPRVRVAASNAAGRILVSFWDVLQTADIRRLLNGELVF